MSDTFELPLPEQNPGGNPAMRASSAEGNIPAPAGGQSKTVKTGGSHGERRSRRRALISAPVRVRSVDLTDGGPDDISTTLDVSRGGLLFVTKLNTFEVAMVVAVTFPYSKSPVAVQAEQVGRVARVAKLPDGRYSVAVTLRSGAGDVVDSGGRTLEDQSAVQAVVPAPAFAPSLDSKKPLVMIVDKDVAVRDSLKSYLTIEGYEVIALATAQEAHHVLNMFTPALLIAEIEGEDLPGYELCAYVKGTPRLQTVPVMLMTSSAYPSDYANAHSLGAVVCIAKPYRQERLGHVVRLLAPLPRAKEQAAPTGPRDTSRRSCPGHAPNIRFRAPW